MPFPLDDDEVKELTAIFHAVSTVRSLLCELN